ncbi:MAG: ATP-binding cassette domain-containing protein [Pseudomonadota bacterium]
MKLSVENLSVDTPDGSRIVRDISFDVDTGEAIGITGPSGAGKSTLLFALAGLTPATAGSISWNVTSLGDLSEAERAAFRQEHLGIVFQDHLLFDELSPIQNADITSLFDTQNRHTAVGTLAALDIPTRRIRSSQLSGGERQRVAIARALAGTPRAVLADEPSASLDHENRSKVMDALFAQTTGIGKTLIIVSHDPQVLYRMDRILTLQAGALAQ